MNRLISIFFLLIFCHLCFTPVIYNSGVSVNEEQCDGDSQNTLNEEEGQENILFHVEYSKTYALHYLVIKASENKTPELSDPVISKIFTPPDLIS